MEAKKMAPRIEEVPTVEHQTSGKVLLENEAYTIVALCERLGQNSKGDEYPLTCCDRCPNYTSVPCSC